MMIRYVAGLMFSPDKSEVVLIAKNKPDWQKGLLNAVGGKIEVGESEQEAMSREFEEEAGVKTLPEQWDKFAELIGVDYVVNFFRCSDEKYLQVKDMTDEKIYVSPTFSFHDMPTVHNLPWLVPMALDELTKSSRIFYV